LLKSCTRAAEISPSSRVCGALEEPGDCCPNLGAGGAQLTGRAGLAGQGILLAVTTRPSSSVGAAHERDRRRRVCNLGVGRLGFWRLMLHAPNLEHKRAHRRLPLAQPASDQPQRPPCCYRAHNSFCSSAASPTIAPTTSTTDSPSVRRLMQLSIDQHERGLRPIRGSLAWSASLNDSRCWFPSANLTVRLGAYKSAWAIDLTFA
jgi:hypothetical protein